MTRFATAAVDGAEVFYREAGDPANETLVLLPGFPSSSAQYQALIDELLARRHLVSPDYPGFGRSPALEGETTFDRIAATTDGLLEQLGLESYSLYMFDFGAPVGFRIATRHPEKVRGLVIQNGNAYEVGLGPNMQALKPYWADRDAHEAEIRGFLGLDVTRSQYVEGAPDPEAVNPDHWELDQRYLEMPSRDRVMLDLLHDYPSNVAHYDEWHEYLRTNRPPVLIAWGENDNFFPPEGARAYLDDVPDAELHLLPTGHFATATHSREIAALIDPFLAGLSG